MQRLNNISNLLMIVGLMVVLFLNFNACSEQSPFQSENVNMKSESGLQILKLGNESVSLAKRVNVSKLITVQNGGSLNLVHGSETGSDGFIYGIDENMPYNIYQIDPSGASSPVLAGHLAFRTAAIAMQPVVEPTPQSTPQSISVLLVVRNAANLTTQENYRKTQMESWGFTVNPISATASQTFFNSSVANNNIAYISEETQSTDLNTKLANAAIGVVNEEANLIDEFGMASYYYWSWDRDLNIVDATHYITAGLSAGYISLFSAYEYVPRITYNSYYHAPGLKTLGKFSNGEPALAILEAGARLYNGGTAAGRRVELPIGSDDLDFNTLTNDSRTLVKRAIEWAANCENDVNTSAGGLVYYVAREPYYGTYRVATWDPATNTNTILSYGSSFAPAYKLTFGADGTLYGVKRNQTYNLYTINTTTGAWTFFRNFNDYLGNGGDMAFGPEGILYNIHGSYQTLQKIDITTNDVTTIRSLNLLDIFGLGFAPGGQLYLARRNGNIYSVNQTTGATNYIFNTGISPLSDLTSFHGQVELSYVNVSLDILPGAISQDAEIELSLETTDILGGVSVTFEPHGITFSQPAILNIVAHGVDLSNVDINNVNIYYDNKDTGLWEPMPRDDIFIDIEQGRIEVINARLPHFSRYAIAAE